MNKTLNWFGSVACVVSLWGCGPDIEKSASPPQAAAPASQTTDAPAAPGAASEPPKVDQGQAKDATAAAPPAAATPAQETKPVVPSTAANVAAAPAAAETPPAAMGEREQATAGVGKKGRGYGGGIVTEPVHQYFTIQQRLVFEDQIPHAMNLYKSQHNDKGPPTHDRFMKEIIAANSIPLPELPPGEKYVYDPKTEELMVEHPAK